MNFIFDEHNSTGVEGILELGYSETVGDLYEQETKNTVGALTIKYIRDFADKVFTASLKIDRITEEQFDSLLNIVAYLHYTEERCGNWLTTDIDVVASVEGEFCFYRKTGKGVSLLSVDEDGDLLVNFTGYKEGFATGRHTYRDIDFEKIVYDFLSN